MASPIRVGIDKARQLVNDYVKACDNKSATKDELSRRITALSGRILTDAHTELSRLYLNGNHPMVTGYSPVLVLLILQKKTLLQGWPHVLTLKFLLRQLLHQEEGLDRVEQGL